MLWIGDSAEPIVRGFRPGKEEPEIEIRLPFEPRQVTRTDRGEMRTAMEGLYSGDRRREWDRFAQSMDFPEYLPFFGGLKVDRLSNLWVQHYEVIGSDGPQMWEVFSQEGAHLATVEIPAPALSHCARRAPSGCGLSRGILEIGDDYLLVAQKDDLGVYTVGKFRLSKTL